MPKLIHYRKQCIGCNACVEIDPGNWEMSEDDGKSNLKCGKIKGGVYRKEIEQDEREKAIEASESCPVNIIKVEE